MWMTSRTVCIQTVREVLVVGRLSGNIDSANTVAAPLSRAISRFGHITVTKILRFVVTGAVYLAILTMVLCLFEQLNLNSFKQSIHERENKREEKEKLLNDYNENNKPIHA